MATPMYKQYNKLKKKYEDCILLFRLGDFYECFDNDAKIISKVLSIVLTSRGKGENSRPMAGIPHHALENYFPKLIKAGYKVAIAEQLEKPQKGKKIVERDVVKIISPGTITSDKSLDQNKNNFIASISKIKSNNNKIYGLAVCDLTTGEFFISDFYIDSNENYDNLFTELYRIKPPEILLSKNIKSKIRNKLKFGRIQEIEEYEFNYKDNYDTLIEHFNVKNLKGFGIEKSISGIISAGVLLKYLINTQKAPLLHINKIYYKKTSNYMILDNDTIRSLELVNPIKEDNKSTLLNTLDKCLTPMGKRKLYNWVISPLINHDEIQDRLDGVEKLYLSSINLEKIRSILDEIFDIERILGKIGTESVNARDLLALKQSLIRVNSISKKISKFNSRIIKDIYNYIKTTKENNEIIELLEQSIFDDPPTTIMEGGIIKEDFNKELKQIKSATREGKNWIKQLQNEEIKRTKISSLKVKYNKIFGYYIEVTKSNLDKVPDNYIRKQTLVNSERFITKELKEKEDLILNSEEKSIELEYKIFIEIREKISRKIKLLQKIAESISVLDCLSNFAYIARLNQYIRPQLLKNDRGIIEIKDGRHPVVENINKDEFISNDAYLDCEDEQIQIITGPNMAGKSTYIRQIALIILMSQIGSYVPAKSMKYEPVDRIFTRVGASDNLASGESTFLVEMNETANILNNATKNSLIVLDEVGRGTSTYDGVAIAWAVAEYIHDKIGAKTLFATHYHELVDLEKYLKRVKNYNVSVKESDGKILFIRKIILGGTDKSYGVHVAQFAGIPNKVIKKAKQILSSLEQEGIFEVKHIESELNKKEKTENKQIPLVTQLPESPIIKELKQININKMTPIEALEKLNEIIKKIKKDNH